nr:neurotrophin 1-like [Penaeus vannamei]
MARNTRGNWRLIVNVDGNPSLRQTTSIEECAREETSCDLLPTLVTSRCIQKHVVHNLLSWAPEEGFYVDSYSLPSACVCYISRVDLHLLYTFVENWDIRH